MKLTPWRRLFIILIVALAFAGGVSLGWYARGGELPVGGMPTAALNQMAVEIDTKAEPTVSMPATEPAPTSTLAPTVAQQPTNTPTASPTPEREEWEIECPVKLVGALVECMELKTGGSEEPGVARIYWVGECLPYNIITLWKQGENNVWREVQRAVGEWQAEFVPNECTRETDRPSPNHLRLETNAGPGTYRISVRADGKGLLLKTFFWNAPMPMPEPTTTITVTPTATPTATPMPAGTIIQEPTRSPYVYGEQCWYLPAYELFIWTDPVLGRRWSLWDTEPFGDGGFFVLGLHEITGEMRWWVGDETNPCINQGLLPGVAGLESYLSRIGKADLEIPPPPAVGDLD